MNFRHNENQLLIADMVQSFMAKEVEPHMKEWDENQTFPIPIFKKLGELGLMGVWYLKNLVGLVSDIKNM